MERIYAFLPSILIIVCIAGTTLLYNKLITKRLGEDNLKINEWVKNNKWKAFSSFAPVIYIGTPAIEELIFRAPLVIIFNTMSLSAWCGILISGGLFALLHWRDGIKFVVNGFSFSFSIFSNKEERTWIEGVNTLCVLILGILTGYYGIKYQSIWVSVGIHALWNLIAPVFFVLFISMGMIVFLVIRNKLDTWKWKRNFIKNNSFR